jgi:hypothetical protein
MKADLRQLDVETFGMRWMFETIPKIFDGDPDGCIEWKVRLAKLLDVDAYSVIILGTACTGISLNPRNDYSAFDDDSDIDVAIVSAYHFELAWRTLQDVGSERYSWTVEAQQVLLDHRKSYLFDGTIATDFVLEHLPFGRSWVLALAQMSQALPEAHKGRDIKVRLYREAHALIAYHLRNLRSLKLELMTPAKAE